MAIKNGTKLGPYEIISPLGAGGMGEVYRAKDARLDREVAIKGIHRLVRDGFGPFVDFNIEHALSAGPRPTLEGMI